MDLVSPLLAKRRKTFIPVTVQGNEKRFIHWQKDWFFLSHFGIGSMMADHTSIYNELLTMRHLRRFNGTTNRRYITGIPSTESSLKCKKTDRNAIQIVELTATRISLITSWHTSLLPPVFQSSIANGRGHQQWLILARFWATMQVRQEGQYSYSYHGF